MRRDEVSSTQDVARGALDDLPVLVIAGSQTRGRGRSGTPWETANRALAVSLAIHRDEDDRRPFSLLAGLAATFAVGHTTLKWPNDVLRDGRKVGGILVERSEAATVIGLGLNLWWPAPSDGAAALFDSDPGESIRDEIGALWGAELMRLVDSEGWPVDEYRAACSTLGRTITWAPEGKGRALDIAEDGALIVETAAGRETIYSGAVHHVRIT